MKWLICQNKSQKLADDVQYNQSDFYYFELFTLTQFNSIIHTPCPSVFCPSRHNSRDSKLKFYFLSKNFMPLISR